MIAAEVTIASSDFGHLEPMVSATQTELGGRGRRQTRLEVVVADAGYWHQKQMEAVIDRGIQVLIPPDAGKRRDTRPGLGRRRLRTTCDACSRPTTAEGCTENAKR